MHAMLEFTVHARQRRQQGKVPPTVVQALLTTATRFVGHRVGGVRVEYRMVRHGHIFWIAAVTAGDVTTTYSKDEREMRQRARNYLLNPEQGTSKLLLLASHRIPTEVVGEPLVECRSRPGCARVA